MRILSRYGLLAIGAAICVTATAQQSTTVSGSVKNSKSKEAISAVSVTIKGSSTGTFTDDKGNFRLSTVQKTPFTLVISSVGYANKEVSVTGSQVVNVEIEPAFTLGDEVVVAASRVPERILESPVSIERISAANIRNSPATNYYDMITNLKGVDVVSASLTFRSIGTRGFNVSGNKRLNQLVDGMDNQAPGLNFAVGGIVGPTELDVDNVELLPGASSALYGAGGMNGTLLINSKSPFKYTGLSFQIKQGIKDVDDKQRPKSAYYDWSVRWAQKISEKFAFKIGAQFIQAQDWLANQEDNYSRTSGTPNGQVIPGSRVTDPNYDGVNVYGDETTVNISPIMKGLKPLFPAAAGPLIDALSASPVNVSRTGYLEKDIVDPITVNVKLNAGLYYKLTDKIEASFLVNFGTGNSVYTGIDRYSLNGLKMSQYKLELKSKNWFLRAYTTHENSGNTFAATTTTRLFNEAWKPSVKNPAAPAATDWYVQYVQAFITASAGGQTAPFAHLTARAAADAGRPTGFIGLNPLFQQVANTPISKGGGLFLDASRLNVFEGQYNLTNDLSLDKSGTDFLIGASTKQYVLNSQGTIFADTAGSIKINEIGAYAQLSQKLLGDILKLTVAGRYDKNTNFAGRFTPRATANIKIAKDHFFRVSYQTAYRFPTTQDQWINLNTSQARLIGGLPQMRDYFKFSSNPVYTQASVAAFGASAAAGAPNAALLQQQQFGEFKPETCASFEVGYKGQIDNKILIDVYAYWAKYKDFNGSVNVIQSTNGSPAGLIGLNANFTPGTGTRNIYNVPLTLTQDVKTNGWGVSVEWLLPKNFNVTGNLYSDVIDKSNFVPGFVSYFNTPKYRTNMSLNNTGFGKDKRYGFSVMYRWTNTFFYEGTFGVGQLPYTRTVDAVVSYKIPSSKSMIKIGGTNIFNKYYRTGFGNAQIGGLYYVSFGWNVY
ncbi:MAG: TonB-dependent receptor [Bacteroidota bacterium]